MQEKFVGRHIIAMDELSREEIEYILEISREMEANRDNYSDLLRGVIVASLFFEPSTRTRMSFESAAHRLGASVISTTGVKFSSLYKGETLYDTAKMVSAYADVIVMRHPEQGAAHALAKGADKPILNAGDGPGDHPTQTLLDLYTIQKNKGTLDGLKVGFVGDLKYGRTVHSLSTALRYFGGEQYFVSPPQLAMPDKYLSQLDDSGIPYHIAEQLDDVLPELDVLYVTRVQKERFDDEEEYERLKHFYVIDQATLTKAKPDMAIMHPLPRVGEIKEEVDSLPNAIYFEQAKNGVPVRMALLALVTGKWGGQSVS